MHAGEDLHWLIMRIDADELFVDFEDAAELAIESFAIDMRQVEINHRLSVEPEAVFVNDLVNGARRDVTRNQVAVFWVPLFEEVKAFRLWDLLEGPFIAGRARNPHAAALAAR